MYILRISLAPSFYVLMYSLGSDFVVKRMQLLDKDNKEVSRLVWVIPFHAISRRKFHSGFLGSENKFNSAFHKIPSIANYQPVRM